jgi:hypothetical protein
MVTAAELDLALARLRAVGGVYDYVAAAVEHDNRGRVTG